MPDRQRLTAAFGGRTLALSSLDKVLFPATGTTKGEVLDYYLRVSGPLLAQLRDRPVTRVRFPHGVGQPGFFEKNAPPSTPEWIPVVRMPADGVFGSPGTMVRWPLLDEVAAVVWVVNLGSVELHTPQWRVVRDAPDAPRPALPDRLVIDLDPGPGVGLAQCAAVALVIRERLVGIGIDPHPVTSGSKGLHLYASLPGDLDAAATSAVAAELAKAAAARLPDLVVSQMAKDKRVGKVFVDWSQNSAAKTTVTPYSLRARPHPAVAAPRRWAEIEAAADGADMPQLTPGEVLDRLDRDGDLLAGPAQ